MTAFAIQGDGAIAGTTAQLVGLVYLPIGAYAVRPVFGLYRNGTSTTATLRLRPSGGSDVGTWTSTTEPALASQVALTVASAALYELYLETDDATSVASAVLQAAFADATVQAGGVAGAGVRTYSSSSGLAKDQVRERIGDFETGRMALDDDLITATLTDLGGSVLEASARCARILYGYLLRQPDRSIESLSINRARLDAYAELVKMLERDAGLLSEAFAGGIQKSEDAAILADTDWRPHTFGVGWMDRDVAEDER